MKTFDSSADSRSRWRHADRVVPVTPPERVGTGIAAALILAAAIGAVAWYLSGYTWPAAAIAIGVSIGPLIPLFLFARPALALWQAKRGQHRVEGTVGAVDRSGIAINEDAQQRALIDVYHTSGPRQFTAFQPGLDLQRGDRVEVSFTSPDSPVCYVHSRERSAGAEGLATDRIMAASPSELLEYLENIEFAPTRPTAPAAAEVPVQNEETRFVQENGMPGRAVVRASELLEEDAHARSFVLTLVVTPADGDAPFSAYMYLTVRRTSPARVQDFANPGASFDVTYHPQDRELVALAPHEISRSMHRG